MKKLMIVLGLVQSMVVYSQDTEIKEKRATFYFAPTLSVNRLILRDELASPLNFSNTSVPFRLRTGVFSKRSFHELAFDWNRQSITNRNSKRSDVLLASLYYTQLWKLPWNIKDRFNFWVGATINSTGRDMAFAARSDGPQVAFGEVFYNLQPGGRVTLNLSSGKLNYDIFLAVLTLLYRADYNPRDQIEFNNGNWHGSGTFSKWDQQLMYQLDLNKRFAFNLYHRFSIYKYKEPRPVKVYNGISGIELMLKL